MNGVVEALDRHGAMVFEQVAGRVAPGVAALPAGERARFFAIVDGVLMAPADRVAERIRERQKE